MVTRANNTVVRTCKLSRVDPKSQLGTGTGGNQGRRGDPPYSAHGRQIITVHLKPICFHTASMLNKKIQKKKIKEYPKPITSVNLIPNLTACRPQNSD